VEEGATLAVIEAIKIEIPIIEPERMHVDAITIEKGQTVKTGQVLFTLRPVA
jgi:urea carboxylase